VLNSLASPVEARLMVFMEIDRVPAHPDIELAEAALDGEADAVAAVMTMLDSPALLSALISRGASATEARDILHDMAGDCFGGERAKGGTHRLLGRYNARCPLPAFFRRIAINRLISCKRASRPMVALDDDADGRRDLPGPLATAGADDALIALLRDAITRARERVDLEKLVMVRLMISYDVPQKQLGALLGWHESKISRAKSDLIAEMRTLIMEEIRRADPWLELEWEDFVALCAESLELFAA
jgi:DNA-directed RNA polymerase specialized sigma24 family protein